MITPKQNAFVLALIENRSQREAYRIAFPNSVNWKDHVVDVRAYELFKKEEVNNLYRELVNEARTKSVATASEVMEFLSATIRGEVKEEVVVTENLKPVIVKKQVSAKDRLKAAELLGKKYLMFTERVQLEGEVKTVVVFEGENDIKD